MLFIEIVNGKAASASSEYPQPGTAYECRQDWKTLEAATRRAEELGHPYVATDAGQYTSPRYDIVAAPQVGEPVSYGFNGDYYPDGVIVSVSARAKAYRVVKTSTGSVYYRRKESACWVKKGGTWRLVRGHRNERNPSF